MSQPTSASNTQARLLDRADGDDGLDSPRVVKVEVVERRDDEDPLSPVRDPDDPAPPEPTAGCCQRYKAPLLLAAYTFISAVPVMLTQPLLIDVQKEYFGSDQKAGMYTSVLASIVAVINLFLIVAYGRLLDSIGRKPAFIASSVIALASFIALAALPNPLAFLILRAVGGFIQSSYGGAWLADLVTPENRAFAFTIVAATGTLSMIASLPVGIVKAPNIVFYLVAIGFAGAALLMSIFIIPESLPKHNRKKFEIKGICENPLSGAKVLVKSKALIIIAIISAVVATADVGTSDIYMFYLNQRVGFDKQDNSIFFVEMSLLAFAGYFFLTPLLMRYISSVTLVAISITGNAALLLLVATIWAKWAVFAFIAPMYMVLVLQMPQLNAIITNIGHERDVGKRLTAMTAVSDFCNAAGPLIFGALYGLLPPTLIAVPFFVFAGLCLAVVVMIWTKLGKAIREDQEKTQRELMEEALLNGDEDAAAAAADGATSPVAVGRTMYNAEDCE